MVADDGKLRQEQREKVAADVQAQNDRDLQDALASPACRRVLLRVLRYTGALAYDVSTFDKNALVMAQNEGIQRVGRWLLAEISFSTPAGYLTMLQENMEEERRLTARLQGDDNA